jgi:hypothetical protein
MLLHPSGELLQVFNNSISLSFKTRIWGGKAPTVLLTSKGDGLPRQWKDEGVCCVDLPVSSHSDLSLYRYVLPGLSFLILFSCIFLDVLNEFELFHLNGAFDLKVFCFVRSGCQPKLFGTKDKKVTKRTDRASSSTG